jgi:adenylate cyclase class IV
MNIINVEFKARVDDSDVYEEKLAALWPVFKGIDHQLDTYFKQLMVVLNSGKEILRMH